MMLATDSGEQEEEEMRRRNRNEKWSRRKRQQQQNRREEVDETYSCRQQQQITLSTPSSSSNNKKQQQLKLLPPLANRHLLASCSSTSRASAAAATVIANRRLSSSLPPLLLQTVVVLVTLLQFNALTHHHYSSSCLALQPTPESSQQQEQHPLPVPAALHTSIFSSLLGGGSGDSSTSSPAQANANSPGYSSSSSSSQQQQQQDANELYQSYRDAQTSDKVTLPGDILLGGLFPIHMKGTKMECGIINRDRGIQRLEAMLYAIDRINEDANLLPGIKLGAILLDSCSSSTYALNQSLEFIRASINTVESSAFECKDKSTPRPKYGSKMIAGVIGGSYSEVSLQVANLLRLFRIPQVSYASTGTALSDKTLYDLFARTVPSDLFQARAIADIVLKLNWSYVSLVSSEGLYGDSGSKEFIKQASDRRICIATHEKISPTHDHDAFDGIVANLFKRNATGVVLFTRAEDARELLLAVKRANLVRQFVWVAADGWGTQPKLVQGVEEVALGAITVDLSAKAIPDFDEYMKTRTPWGNARNPWFSEYWQEWFDCQLQANLLQQQQLASGTYSARRRHVSVADNWSPYSGGGVADELRDMMEREQQEAAAESGGKLRRRSLIDNDFLTVGNKSSIEQTPASSTRRDDAQQLHSSDESKDHLPLPLPLPVMPTGKGSGSTGNSSTVMKNNNNNVTFDITFEDKQQQQVNHSNSTVGYAGNATTTTTTTTNKPVETNDDSLAHQQQQQAHGASRRSKRSPVAATGAGGNPSARVKKFCSPNLRISESNGYRQEQKVQFVVDAVFAMAHALHKAWYYLCGARPGLVCESLKELNGGDFYSKYLLNVSFLDEAGSEVKFDEHGDGIGRYNIYNFRQVRKQQQRTFGGGGGTNSIPTSAQNNLRSLSSDGGGDGDDDGDILTGDQSGATPTFKSSSSALAESGFSSFSSSSSTTNESYGSSELLVDSSGLISDSENIPIISAPDAGPAPSSSEFPAGNGGGGGGQQEREQDHRVDEQHIYVSNEFEYSSVGRWTENDYYLQLDDIQFITSGNLNSNSNNQNQPRIPESYCSRPCELGHAKIMRAGDHCCWICKPCSPWEFLPDEFSCRDCGIGRWPVENKTSCFDLPQKYLRWDSIYSLISLSIACLGIALTLFVTTIFIKYIDTPVVKASGRELSFILLAGIAFCHLSTFVLLSKPTTFICGSQRFLVNFGFALMYASLLVKTNRISRIFNCARKTAKRPSFISPRSQMLITGILVVIQIFLTIVWFMFEPAGVRADSPEGKRDEVILKCKAKGKSFIISLVYNMILITTCTVYAVKTRKIPENFNESKFIGFTMYTTIVIWLAFVTMFFGTNNSYEIQINTMCVCISLSAYVTLFCLFSPKISIILLHPDKNVRKNLTMNSATYKRPFKPVSSMASGGGGGCGPDHACGGGGATTTNTGGNGATMTGFGGGNRGGLYSSSATGNYPGAGGLTSGFGAGGPETNSGGPMSTTSNVLNLESQVARGRESSTVSNVVNSNSAASQCSGKTPLSGAGFSQQQLNMIASGLGVAAQCANCGAHQTITNTSSSSQGLGMGIGGGGSGGVAGAVGGIISGAITAGGVLAAAAGHSHYSVLSAVAAGAPSAVVMAANSVGADGTEGRAGSRKGRSEGFANQSGSCRSKPTTTTTDAGQQHHAESSLGGVASGDGYLQQQQANLKSSQGGGSSFHHHNQMMGMTVDGATPTSSQQVNRPSHRTGGGANGTTTATTHTTAQVIHNQIIHGVGLHDANGNLSGQTLKLNRESAEAAEGAANNKKSTSTTDKTNNNNKSRKSHIMSLRRLNETVTSTTSSGAGGVAGGHAHCDDSLSSLVNDSYMMNTTNTTTTNSQENSPAACGGAGGQATIAAAAEPAGFPEGGGVAAAGGGYFTNRNESASQPEIMMWQHQSTYSIDYCSDCCPSNCHCSCALCLSSSNGACDELGTVTTHIGTTATNAPALVGVANNKSQPAAGLICMHAAAENNNNNNNNLMMSDEPHDDDGAGEDDDDDCDEALMSDGDDDLDDGGVGCDGDDDDDDDDEDEDDDDEDDDYDIMCDSLLLSGHEDCSEMGVASVSESVGLSGGDGGYVHHHACAVHNHGHDDDHHQQQQVRLHRNRPPTVVAAAAAGTIGNKPTHHQTNKKSNGQEREPNSRQQQQQQVQGTTTTYYFSAQGSAPTNASITTTTTTTSTQHQQQQRSTRHSMAQTMEMRSLLASSSELIGGAGGGGSKSSSNLQRHLSADVESKYSSMPEANFCHQQQQQQQQHKLGSGDGKGCDRSTAGTNLDQSLQNSSPPETVSSNTTSAPNSSEQQQQQLTGSAGATANKSSGAHDECSPPPPLESEDKSMKHENQKSRSSRSIMEGGAAVTSSSSKTVVTSTPTTTTTTAEGCKQKSATSATKRRQRKSSATAVEDDARSGTCSADNQDDGGENAAVDHQDDNEHDNDEDDDEDDFAHDGRVNLSRVVTQKRKESKRFQRRHSSASGANGNGAARQKKGSRQSLAGSSSGSSTTQNG